MSKYRVYMTATIEQSVTVEIDDTDMDADEAKEAAIEKAYEEAPGDICAHCSGWRQPWSRDIGDFEVENGEDAVEKIED